jgi:hypothetical protein
MTLEWLQGYARSIKNILVKTNKICYLNKEGVALEAPLFGREVRPMKERIAKVLQIMFDTEEERETFVIKLNEVVMKVCAENNKMMTVPEAIKELIMSM